MYRIEFKKICRTFDENIDKYTIYHDELVPIHRIFTHLIKSSHISTIRMIIGNGKTIFKVFRHNQSASDIFLRL